MKFSQHTEWLSLIERTGPFLAVGCLEDAFPQGLDKTSTTIRQRVRAAYDEWREAVDSGDPQIDALHREWLRLVFHELLEYDDTILRARDCLPDELRYNEPLSGDVVQPDFAVMANDKARILICMLPPESDPNAPVLGSKWFASPIERMTALCRATGVAVGIVTDGERWAVVGVPKDGTSSVATWYARIWHQEPVTLQAFQSLLTVRRCFGEETGTLDAILQRSLEHQDEVTDTLGEQVRRAVEVLVQALDRADDDRNRELLKDISEPQLYEAGLTVMMRLVFLMCAEERGLLLLGEPVYDQFYAVTTLRARLREDADRLGLEVLDRRQDAWSRLLATFRAVHGGIEHETLRLPALGGSLFDPDRFPFLEGRASGTSWKDKPAVPLPIDNRTVLLLLTALQVLEQSSGAQLLSYQALDVEQIGHVYEGLLERTVKRVPEITLGLQGTAKLINPNASLSEIEALADMGEDALAAWVKEQTGRNVKRALNKAVDSGERHLMLHACGGDGELAKRIEPFFHLLRTDSWGEPIVYRAGSFVVTMGHGRRETGTHYTPKSLTEPIVKHTLEPLVYVGSAEGKPQNEWKLKTPAEILSLKVCDMAMGSAAFLVQACRWMAERLVEAWAEAEADGKVISIEGLVLDSTADVETMPEDKSERLLLARRLIASRCLYGVDINPMAVELAKLSLWLVTMQKNRPFNFLDHALKCGDSLVGVSDIKQLENFSICAPDTDQPLFETANLWRLTEQAAELRRKLESLPNHTVEQIAEKARLHAEAEALTAKLKAAADFLVAAEIRAASAGGRNTHRALAASQMQSFWDKEIHEFRIAAKNEVQNRNPFHWAIEYPEVFEANGFNAIMGNPPWFFLSGKANPVKRLLSEGATKEAEILSETISYCSQVFPDLTKGAKDFYKWFTGRASTLVGPSGNIGLLLSNSFISLPKYADLRIHLTSAYAKLTIFDLGFGFFSAVVSCAIVIANRVSAEPCIFIADLKDIGASRLREINTLKSHYIAATDISNGNFALFKSEFAKNTYFSARHNLGEIMEIREGHHYLTFDSGDVEVAAFNDKKMRQMFAPEITRGFIPNGSAGLDWHSGPRFLLRKTGDCLVAALSPKEEEIVAHQNVYVCRPSVCSPLTAKALCALVSSTIMTQLYQDGPLGQKGRVMAQLRIVALRNLPIPEIEILKKANIDLENAYGDICKVDSIVNSLFYRSSPTSAVDEEPQQDPSRANAMEVTRCNHGRIANIDCATELKFD